MLQKTRDSEVTTTERRAKPGPKPRLSRLVQASVMLDREELSQLDQVVQSEGRSRSDLIREALRRTWLKRFDR